MKDYDKIADEQIQEELLKKAEALQQRQSQQWPNNFGMIAALGGVIILPLLICLFCGMYLEKIYHNPKFLLCMIVLGFVWGLINAYFWIKNENAKIMAKENKQAQQIVEGLKK